MLADRMGSVRNVVDNTGAVIDTITYDGYGNIATRRVRRMAGSYKAFGYRYDSETGWLRPDLSIGRYFNPATGRWLSADPLGLEPDSNLYRYVKNNSVNLIDPTGADFIAIADRRIKRTDFYHYSLQYWKSEDAGPSKEMRITTWFESHKGTKEGSVELLPTEFGEYKTWTWIQQMDRWVVDNVFISVISYDGDDGISFRCIYENKDSAAVKQKWAVIVDLAAPTPLW